MTLVSISGDKVKTIKIKSRITKWQQTGEGYEAPLKIGERLGFRVGRFQGGNRDCIISADIHIATENTTFILDISIESAIEFSNDTTASPQAIYELYKEVKPKWRNEILQRGIKQGHINPMIVIDHAQTPFESIKDSIQNAIAQSLDQTN